MSLEVFYWKFCLVALFNKFGHLIRSIPLPNCVSIADSYFAIATVHHEINSGNTQ